MQPPAPIHRGHPLANGTRHLARLITCSGRIPVLPSPARLLGDSAGRLPARRRGRPVLCCSAIHQSRCPRGAWPANYYLVAGGDRCGTPSPSSVYLAIDRERRRAGEVPAVPRSGVSSGPLLSSWDSQSRLIQGSVIRAHIF